MPAPTKEWSKPYLGLQHYTGYGYHVFLQDWESFYKATIMPLNSDNSWKGFSEVDSQVFRKADHEDHETAAKRWAENWTPGQRERDKARQPADHVTVTYPKQDGPGQLALI